jgi:Domain of unknown function (DUF222)/HNH endonuclease
VLTPAQIMALAEADGVWDDQDEDDPAWCPGADEAAWAGTAEARDGGIAEAQDAGIAEAGDGGIAEAGDGGIAEVWGAGFTHDLPGQPGPGFAAGGVLDRMLPGRELAAVTGTALGNGLDRLSDDELIGFLCAARRNTSWQQAAELAAVADLEQRRAGADGSPGEHVASEVAAALTLTSRAAEALLALADGIMRLAQVPAALAAGVIDLRRAEVFARELLPLDDELAVRAEAMVMHRAPELTTGQLAAALQRAVAAVDPAAAQRRKKRSEQDARVEAWTEPGRGTAALAGRDLPTAEVIAADQRLTAAARWLKANGAPGTMDWLRSRAYLAFINGYNLHDTLASLTANGTSAHDQRDSGSHDAAGTDEAASAGSAASTTSTDNSANADSTASAGNTASAAGAGSAPGAGSAASAGGVQDPAALASPAAPPGLAALAGTVNLTMPALAWLGLCDAPGEASRFGALDAGTCRDLATALAAHPATRWCVTLTSPDGRAVAHGCARAGPGPPATSRRAWLATITITPIETGTCSHRRESAGYQPSPSLRHIIKIRSPRCGYPGCRRPATGSDDDHTIPYDKGGKTCECNLHPLCRRHHQAKQAPGWHLTQPHPGELIWTLPSGRQYTATHEPYPV